MIHSTTRKSAFPQIKDCKKEPKAQYEEGTIKF